MNANTIQYTIAGDDYAYYATLMPSLSIYFHARIIKIELNKQTKTETGFRIVFFYSKFNENDLHRNEDLH